MQIIKISNLIFGGIYLFAALCLGITLIFSEPVKDNEILLKSVSHVEQVEASQGSNMIILAANEK